MREEIRQLQAETRGLRHQRWAWAAVFLACGLAFPAVSGPKAPQDLVCRSLKVLGSDGKARIVLRVGMDVLPAAKQKDGTWRQTPTNNEVGFIEVLDKNGNKSVE